ncbi:MAG: CPBP family intramembrane metalloprotease [Prevotella sp.]|nr:CPBP family intramembrane metalloprotease [Prevotella sp.]
MKKQFWIMVKQFLLYLLLDQGVALPLMIPVVIYGVIKGYKGEVMQELLTTSSGALCVMILCSILTITVFLKKQYVKIRPGRIERSNFGKAAGYAMLIAWGWMFTEVALLQLIGINKIFPEEEEHFDTMVKMMNSPLGLIAGGILAPIVEEIVFRGVLVGGLLRMRQKPWVAIVVPALIFALFHGTFTQFVGTAIFGIICGWLYWRTKSLLPGIFIHITNNSTAFVSAAFSDDPNADLPTKICLLFLVIFPPLLVIGLRWYKGRAYEK